MNAEWLAGVIAFASPVMAAPICPVEGPPRAKIVVAGEDRAVQAVSEGLRDSLGRIGVTARVSRAAHIDPRDVARPVSCEPSLVARLFVDLEGASTMVLYLTDARGDRVFVRPFALEHGLDLVAREALELVAQSSVETLLSGKELGIEREEYGRSLKPPKPSSDQPGPSSSPAPRRPSLTLRATGFYEISLLAADVVQHGPGVGIESEWWAGRLGVTIHGRFPVHFDDPAISGRLVPEGLRLFFARPFALSRSTLASAGIAAGVDVTEVGASARQADAQADPSFWVVDPLVRTFATIEHRTGPFRISAMLGVEFDVIAARYVVARQGDRQSVFVPWRFRPLAALLLSAEL